MLIWTLVELDFSLSSYFSDVKKKETSEGEFPEKKSAYLLQTDWE